MFIERRHRSTLIASSPPHDVYSQRPQPENKDQRQQQLLLAEECQHLRRLQAFRVRNASALISLVSHERGRQRHTDSDTKRKRLDAGWNGEEDATRTISRRGEGNPEVDASREVPVTYRLNHLVCSLTPVVSCYKVDYTRPEHPSDEPPIVGGAQLDDAMKSTMLTRLVIPNTAPTSIRSVDHHRLCMALATGDNKGPRKDSLSIGHQVLGLEARGGGVGGSSCSLRVSWSAPAA